MASQVFLHIGLPKTGTTYLQSVLWGSKAALARDGFLLPGSGHREHLWAALELQERPNLAQAAPQGAGHAGPAGQGGQPAPGAGDPHPRVHVRRRPRAGPRGWSSRWLPPRCTWSSPPATPSACSPPAGRSTSRTAAPGRSREMRGDRLGGQGEFGWRTWDLGGVLRRWGRHVPAGAGARAPDARPGRAARPALAQPRRGARPRPGPVRRARRSRATRRSASSRSSCCAGSTRTSTAFRKPVDRGTWIRGYLAEGHLVRQEGERLGADDEQVAECRRAGRPRHGHHRAARVPRRRATWRASGCPPSSRTRPRPGDRVGCGTSRLQRLHSSRTCSRTSVASPARARRT